jgi:hypothetical protein
MPTLLETQQAMFRALLFRDTDDAAVQVAGGPFLPDERLDIYRNTLLSSLTSALRISYPAVYRLVGEEFFEGAAQLFIQAHPPQSAYLNAYGAQFAEFLAQFPPASGLPYLADVARLEWAVNGALHANDATPLDGEALAAVAGAPADRLVLLCHPSLSLLHLDWPAEAIWRAVLANDDEALAAIDLKAGSQWLMIERTPSGVEVISLPESEWRFNAGLAARKPLQDLLAVAGDADIPSLLARHFAAGRFIGFRLIPDDPLYSEKIS